MFLKILKLNSYALAILFLFFVSACSVEKPQETHKYVDLNTVEKADNKAIADKNKKEKEEAAKKAKAEKDRARLEQERVKLAKQQKIDDEKKRIAAIPNYTLNIVKEVRGYNVAVINVPTAAYEKDDAAALDKSKKKKDNKVTASIVDNNSLSKVTDKEVADASDFDVDKYAGQDAKLPDDLKEAQKNKNISNEEVKKLYKEYIQDIKFQEQSRLYKEPDIPQEIRSNHKKILSELLATKGRVVIYSYYRDPATYDLRDVPEKLRYLSYLNMLNRYIYENKPKNIIYKQIPKDKLPADRFLFVVVHVKSNSDFVDMLNNQERNIFTNIVMKYDDWDKLVQESEKERLSKTVVKEQVNTPEVSKGSSTK